jgi:uncharacterized protein YciI
MQFIIIAHDYTDEQALERRLHVREDHLARCNHLKDNGHLLFAAAKLNDEGKMIGSMLVVDFPNRLEVEQWVATDPYVIGDVWEKIDITPCQVSPSFS